MRKKLFISSLILALTLLISTTCFANNISFENEMSESKNKAENTMQDFGQGVMNFANDVGSGIKNTAEDIGNSMQNMFDGDNPNTTTGNDYNAVRTSTDTNGTNGMANTAWVWLILGVTGIVIIALTWYYVSQENGHTSRR